MDEPVRHGVGDRGVADVIVDLSHHTKIKSLSALRAAGILAIIHKSTEGTVFADPDFDVRRKAARKAGFLWCSYHFTSGEPPRKQLDFFLDKTTPDEDELVAIDFEPSSPGATDMTLDQLLELVGCLVPGCSLTG